jgi:hypothetical protein
VSAGAHSRLWQSTPLTWGGVPYQTRYITFLVIQNAIFHDYCPVKITNDSFTNDFARDSFEDANITFK